RRFYPRARVISRVCGWYYGDRLPAGLAREEPAVDPERVRDALATGVDDIFGLRVAQLRRRRYGEGTRQMQGGAGRAAAGLAEQLEQRHPRDREPEVGERRDKRVRHAIGHEHAALDLARVAGVLLDGVVAIDRNEVLSQ